MERILLKTFSFPCIVKVYLFFEYLKGHTWRMSKKRRKGGFCEKKTKLDTRYEKREGFEKKMDIHSHKTFIAKIQAENWIFFF